MFTLHNIFTKIKYILIHIYKKDMWWYTVRGIWILKYILWLKQPDIKKLYKKINLFKLKNITIKNICKTANIQIIIIIIY